MKCLAKILFSAVFVILITEPYAIAEEANHLRKFAFNSEYNLPFNPQSYRAYKIKRYEDRMRFIRNECAHICHFSRRYRGADFESCLHNCMRYRRPG